MGRVREAGTRPVVRRSAPAPRDTRSGPLIFITAKFPVKPEHADDWPELSRAFTDATRAEDGCLWFDWSRSLEDPNEYVLVEAFKDDAAGDHVNSGHFKKAMADMPQALVETPKIISRQLDGEGWDLMGELTV